MKCDNDCFNCPYPDCINDYVKPSYLESRRKWYQKNKERLNAQRREKGKERVQAGLCKQCGKRQISKKSKVRCDICLEINRKRQLEQAHKNGVLPKVLLDGVDRCKICGKHPPVDGYTICERCLQVCRNNASIARDSVNKTEVILYANSEMDSNNEW